MFEYAQEVLDNQRDTTAGDNLVILHGPFSPLHIESKYSPNAKVATLSTDTKSTYYIPQTEDIGRSELFDGISKELKHVPKEKQQSVVNNLAYMLKEYGSQTYGEYQPGTYNLKTHDLLDIEDENLEGKSVHPVLFLTHFLLQESDPNSQKKEIVLHPDSLFFLSQGQKERVGSALWFLNSLAKDLNLKIFIENLELANPKMQKAFNMFLDPSLLSHMFKKFSNLGVAIDIKHMERHYNKESIGNNVASVVNSTDSSKVLIHSRLGHEIEYSSTYNMCIKKGIPWVVEE